MPPSCSSGSSQHKMPPVPGSRFFTAQSTLGKGARALFREGGLRDGGRNRIRESRSPRSERHPGTAQLRLRAATPADRAGLVRPVVFPSGAHFHFRSSARPLLLLVSHFRPRGLSRAVRPGSALGSHLLFKCGQWKRLSSLGVGC